MRRLALLLTSLLLLTAAASAQARNNVRYVDQFGGSTVGAKATLAQNACEPNTPCVIVFDTILAAFPEGTLPAKCAKCLWLDFRTDATMTVSKVTASTTLTVGDGTATGLVANSKKVNSRYQVVIDFWASPDGRTQTPGASYIYPGVATSASFRPWRFDKTLGKIIYAELDVVWTPNAVDSAVRLIHADDGPANVTQIKEVTGLNSATPVNSTFDITTEMQTVQNLGLAKQLGWQIKGTSSFTVHKVSLVLVYELADAS